MPSATALLDFIKLFPVQLLNWIKSFTKSPTIIYSDPIFRMTTRYLPALFVLITCLNFTVNYFHETDITCTSSRNKRLEKFGSAEKGSRPYEVDLNTYCWNHGTFLVKKALDPEMRHKVPYPGVSAYNRKTDALVHQGYYSSLWIGLAIAGGIAFIINFMWKLKGEKKMKSLIDVEKILASATMSACECRAALFNENVGYNKSFGRDYLCYKFLSALVPAATMGYLSGYIGSGFLLYGINVTKYWANGGETWPSPYDVIFPLMAKCERNRVGFSGDIEVEGALCQLPMNIASRYCFLALWWLLTTVFVVSFLHLTFMLRYCFNWYRQYVIRSYLAVVCAGAISDVKKHVNAKKEDGIANLIYVNISFGDWLILHLLKKNLTGPEFRNMIWQVATSFTIANGTAGLHIMASEQMDLRPLERKNHESVRSGCGCTDVDEEKAISGTLKKDDLERREELEEHCNLAGRPSSRNVSVAAMVAAIEDGRS